MPVTFVFVLVSISRRRTVWPPWTISNFEEQTRDTTYTGYALLPCAFVLCSVFFFGFTWQVQWRLGSSCTLRGLTAIESDIDSLEHSGPFILQSEGDSKGPGGAVHGF